MEEAKGFNHAEYFRKYKEENPDRVARWNANRRRNPERNRKNQQDYLARTPWEVKAARWTLGKALQRGKIQRPDACQACGAVGKVEGHHYRGYAREFWLDVRWLCKICHGREHRRNKKRAPAQRL